jgi:hypothetical protein
MNSKGMWSIVIVLIIIIGTMAWLWAKPVEAPATGAATTTPAGTDTSGSTPLNERVVIDAPKSGATVPSTFTVTGKAPGPWFFEASFPVQVRDENNNKVGQGIATALSDWMTVGDVAFKADITVASYKGPATLVLMRDNPSGMPENDDSVSLPIVIQ